MNFYELYYLSLHDALPISSDGLLRLHHRRRMVPVVARRREGELRIQCRVQERARLTLARRVQPRDRKSTRLNSSHTVISYAVYCLKKKNQIKLALDLQVSN